MQPGSSLSTGRYLLTSGADRAMRRRPSFFDSGARLSGLSGRPVGTAGLGRSPPRGRFPPPPLLTRSLGVSSESGCGAFSPEANRRALHGRRRASELSRVPDDARFVRVALVVPCFFDQSLEVVARTPAEQELRFRVIEPGRVVRRADLDGGKAARLGEVGAELPVVDRLVHAD